MQRADCEGCGDPFWRYSTIGRFCGPCTQARKGQKPVKARSPMKRSAKPIKQRGKEYNKWISYRNKVVRPHLDKTQGRGCADCGVMPPLRQDGSYGYHDVDHVKGKGAHAESKGELSNFAYLCRKHHIKKTGVIQWSTATNRPDLDLRAMRAELDEAAKAVREAMA